MKQLVCRIYQQQSRLQGAPIDCCDYVVFDEFEVVAQGSSSTPERVRHDAGGYHTKMKFDELYPEGWVVEFEF